MGKSNLEYKLNNLLKKYSIELPEGFAQEILHLIEFEGKEQTFKLKESKEKYQKLVQNQGEGIVISDENEIFRFSNPAADNIFGVKKGQLVGKSIIDFLAPKERDKVYKETKKRKKGAKSNYELQILRPDGESRIINITVVPELDDSGKYISSFGIFRDITLRKEIENDLKASEEKYRRLTENAPVVTYIYSLNKGALFWSSKVKEILGFDPDNLKGDTEKWTNAIYEKDKPKIDKFFKNIKAGKKYQLEYRIYDIHNNLHWFEDKIFNVYKDGDDYIVEGLIVDITDKKKAERALKESEEKFRTITNSAQDAIILINNEGNVIHWNKAAEEIFQYNHKEVVGKSLHKLIAPKEYLKEFERAFEIFKNTGKGKAINKIIELTAKRKDESNVPVELALSALKLNESWHAVGIIRDITERKKSELSLKEKNIQLQGLNATKDKFFSILAHDLRGPINNLVGFTDLLEKKYFQYDEKKLSHIISLMNTAAKRTFNLLENLLLWARSQREKLISNPQAYQCKDLVKEVFTEMEHLAFAKNITIKTNNEANSHLVFVDKDMFKTVFRNLISNAIKYTNDGGEISIGCGKENNEFLEFFVKDNGIGIPKETIDKLFRIDENITTEGTNKERGTGLGLILCKDFVEKHGGKIWVKSIENKGSTFWFTFPKPVKK